MGENDTVPAGMERVTVRRGRTVEVPMIVGQEMVGGELQSTYGTRTMSAGETLVVTHDEAADLHASGFVFSPTRLEPQAVRPNGTSSHPTPNPAGIGAGSLMVW